MKTSNIQIINLDLKSGPKTSKGLILNHILGVLNDFVMSGGVFVGQDIDDSTGQQNGSIKGSAAVESLRKYKQLVSIGKGPSRNAYKCLCA